MIKFTEVMSTNYCAQVVSQTLYVSLPIVSRRVLLSLPLQYTQHQLERSNNQKKQNLRNQIVNTSLRTTPKHTYI